MSFIVNTRLVTHFLFKRHWTFWILPYVIDLTLMFLTHTRCHPSSMNYNCKQGQYTLHIFNVSVINHITLWIILDAEGDRWTQTVGAPLGTFWVGSGSLSSPLWLYTWTLAQILSRHSTPIHMSETTRLIWLYFIYQYHCKIIS